MAYSRKNIWFHLDGVYVTKILSNRENIRVIHSKFKQKLKNIKRELKLFFFGILSCLSLLLNIYNLMWMILGVFCFITKKIFDFISSDRNFNVDLLALSFDLIIQLQSIFETTDE